MKLDIGQVLLGMDKGVTSSDLSGLFQERREQTGRSNYSVNEIEICCILYVKFFLSLKQSGILLQRDMQPFIQSWKRTGDQFKKKFNMYVEL